MIDPRCKIGRVTLKTGNVVFFPAARLNIPASRVLAGALEEGLTEVVVSGTRPDGSSYYATNLASGPSAVWLAEKFKLALLG